MTFFKQKKHNPPVFRLKLIHLNPGFNSRLDSGPMKKLYDLKLCYHQTSPSYATTRITTIQGHFYRIVY